MRRENSVENNTINVENGGRSMKGLFKNMKKKVIPALSGSLMAGMHYNYGKTSV